MGREVRRVPPNWNHPRKMYLSGLGYQPMFDETFAAATARWNEGQRKWDAGEDPSREQYKNDDGSFQTYAEWHGDAPDDPAYYRPWEDHEATWFQLWETVSEGSPVTPPFATKEELVTYLAEHGDEWDEKRGNPGWGHERAKAFVEAGWAPSFVMAGNTLHEAKDVPLLMKDTK